MAETCSRLNGKYQNMVQLIGSKFVCNNVVFVLLIIRQAAPAAEDKSKVNPSTCKPRKHRWNGYKCSFILIPKTAWGGNVQMVLLLE